jgi:hypothetical protein
MSNQLHGLMSEYGVALPKGWAVMLKQRLAEFLRERFSVTVSETSREMRIARAAP